MTTLQQQTNGEILRVITDWKTLYAPENLLEDDQTVKLLVDYVVKNYGGIVSFTSLNAAVEALGSQVLAPAPKVKTTDELAAEEIEKQRRDYMESIKPQTQDVVANVSAKKAADVAAKAQSDAKGALTTAIASYQCYRTNGGGIDYTGTEMVQKELSAVKVGNDFVRTLAVVRQIIQELPDHPVLGDVNKVVKVLNDRNQPQKEYSIKVRRDSREWNG